MWTAQDLSRVSTVVTRFQFGSFTLSLNIDLEVDDLIEVLLFREVDFSAVHDLGGVGSFISIVENIGTPEVSVSGGGGGGAPGWIEPKDEYDEDDLHKFLIENGVLKEIVLRDAGRAFSCCGVPGPSERRIRA